MAKIDIRRPHKLGSKGARKAVSKVADELCGSFNLNHRWDKDCVRFKRHGVDGVIEVSDKEVRVQVKLGLMLSAMKGAIEKEIQRYLDETLDKG